MDETARAALQRAGQRLTPQRLAVAGALARAGEDASVHELYDRLRRTQPYIGRATVFRALDMLVAAGLAQRIERPGHVSTYIWCEPGHHHHLICSRCRTVEDLDEKAVAPLARTIARERGFRVDHARLDFYGVCRACAAGAPAGQPRGQRTAPAPAGWWRRRESNSRPKQRPARSLRA